MENYFIYNSSLQKFPTPMCICFYNGTDKSDIPDKTVLKLSDAFWNPEESDIELKVKMININYGHNDELLKTCKPLDE